MKKQKSKTVANDSPNSGSTKEKQPTNCARVKGRRGKLRNTTKMPLDVLYEVFGQLEPVDLLHLSQATKNLRAILLASTATFLWTRV
jgi:hypothetical protein